MQIYSRHINLHFQAVHKKLPGQIGPSELFFYFVIFTIFFTSNQSGRLDVSDVREVSIRVWDGSNSR
jgi:hypothetical protein